jgi:hypothetical protein
VSIEIEFTVQTEQFHPVRVAIRGENVGDVFTQMASITEGHREILGDYHASLKAAVLYGRDKALEAVAKAEPPVRDEPFASTQEYMEASFREPPQEAQQDPVKLLTEELGATVLEVTEKSQEGPTQASPAGSVNAPKEIHLPSSPSTDRPWKNKPATKKTKAWEVGDAVEVGGTKFTKKSENPFPEAPAEKPELTKGDNWDW